MNKHKAITLSPILKKTIFINSNTKSIFLLFVSAEDVAKHAVIDIKQSAKGYRKQTGYSPTSEKISK
jgi:hypothetical protein